MTHSSNILAKMKIQYMHYKEQSQQFLHSEYMSLHILLDSIQGPKSEIRILQINVVQTLNMLSCST